MRILVAADGSSHANRALDFAARLAKEVKGVEVTLINVGHIPITEIAPIGNPGYVDYGAMEEATRKGRSPDSRGRGEAVCGQRHGASRLCTVRGIQRPKSSEPPEKRKSS